MKRLFAVFLVLLATPLSADPPPRSCSTSKWGNIVCIYHHRFVQDTCNAIEKFSLRHGLDPHFFARLIWQESRFDPNALSPAGAQGIAQFMPHTAKRRGLSDAYNPAEALDHSAHYLAEMAEKYGNLGLAAVGYNGGERRAEGLIDETGGLAQETIDYVRIITGVPHQNWLEDPLPEPDLRLSQTLTFQPACHDLAKNRRLTKLKEVNPLVRPWGIQMAFGTTQKKALSKFKKSTRACAALFKGETPELIFEKSRASPKGGYFMARLGRDTRDQAWRDCSKFRKSGCVCRVYRNE